MTSVELRLRPATAGEIEAWLPRLAAEYAAHSRPGFLPPADARRKVGQSDLCRSSRPVQDRAGS